MQLGRTTVELETRVHLSSHAFPHTACVKFCLCRLEAVQKQPILQVTNYMLGQHLIPDTSVRVKYLDILSCVTLL